MIYLFGGYSDQYGISNRLYAYDISDFYFISYFYFYFFFLKKKSSILSLPHIWFYLIFKLLQFRFKPMAKYSKYRTKSTLFKWTHCCLSCPNFKIIFSRRNEVPINFITFFKNSGKKKK